MNYNNPLMMRRGRSTRRRSGRRGGVDSLMARRRQQRGYGRPNRPPMSPEESMNPLPGYGRPNRPPMSPEERMNPLPGYGRPNRPPNMYERMIERRTGNNPPPNWGLPNRGQQFRAGGGVYSPPPMFDLRRDQLLKRGRPPGAQRLQRPSLDSLLNSRRSQVIPASRDALQQMLDLLASNAKVLGRRR